MVGANFTKAIMDWFLESLVLLYAVGIFLFEIILYEGGLWEGTAAEGYGNVITWVIVVLGVLFYLAPIDTIF